jgi:hypothetical protein
MNAPAFLNDTPMSELAPYSTFDRPTPGELLKWRVWHLKDDTVRYYLAKGFSLVLCCRNCPRMVEWTPPQLFERFGNKLDLRLQNLMPRLSCSRAQGGCGATDIAAIPHLYDALDWTWPPAASAG